MPQAGQNSQNNQVLDAFLSIAITAIIANRGLCTYCPTHSTHFPSRIQGPWFI